MQKPRTRRFIARFFVIEALLASTMTIGSGVAEASTTCGVSNGHTLCVTVPDTPLTGPAAITKEVAAGFAPQLVVAVEQ